MILLGFANFQLSNRLEKPVAIYPSMTVLSFLSNKDGYHRPKKSRKPEISLLCRSKRADFKHKRADFEPERAALRPKRADLRPERADLRPEGADWGHTNEKINGRTNIRLRSTGLCPLWGRCPKMTLSGLKSA